MSNMLGQTTSRDQTRTLPQGETVGTYTAYLDAQKAVDYLADQQFAVQNVSILGNDLKTVEQVTGRLTYPRVALAAAATGAWFGLFVGVVLMLFGGTETYSTLLSSMALGAGFWMLFGVITYAMQRGKRDFTSKSQVVASNYQVIVSPEAAGEARRLLQQLPMNGKGGPAGPGYGPGQGPNQYGGPGQYGPGQGYGPGSPGQYGPGQGYGPGGPGYGQGGPGYGPGGQGGQAPERPAGWEDPYQDPKPGNQNQPQVPQNGQGWQPGPGGTGGQPAPQQGAPPQQPRAPQAQPQQPQAQPQQPQPQQPPEDSPRRGQFRDLPDGRPQYGERLPAAQPPPPGQQHPSEGPNLNQPGQSAQQGQQPTQPARPQDEPGQQEDAQSGPDSQSERPEDDSSDRQEPGKPSSDRSSYGDQDRQ
ncbi:general stress protein [Arthrobacter castelli]|uniref:general stress protein n=1 Tax=Arthrobacter castelli TaxID=271431 RepID=UPI001B7F8456